METASSPQVSSLFKQGATAAGETKKPVYFGSNMGLSIEVKL